MGDATRVEEHLDTCGTCFALVAELARADPDDSDPTRMLSVTDAPPDHEDDGEAEQTRLAPVGPLTPPPSEPGSASHPPTQLGRYTILHRLGVGAMGVVYAAVDRELGRRVALKLIEATGADAVERGARLLREAQALARLTHPHVVTIYDAGRVDGQVFVSMELVTGSTVGEWLRAQKRTWPEILELFLQAASGLAAAHAAGIIHRDFKPSNVLVDEQSRARVVDFGLARAFGPVADDSPTVIRATPKSPGDEVSGVLGRSGSELSESGYIAGTPAYMAPEQHDGLGDARIDQFAFCVTLYEALFGRRPFVGADASKLYARLMTGVPPDIPLHSTVPDWLARIILRGLSRNPEHRFASMDGLLAEVSAAQRRRVVWRRIAIAGGGASIVGVMVATAIAHEQSHPCEDADEQLVGIWDETSTATMKAAIEASGAPYGAQGWTTAHAAVDRWATSWTDAASQLCRARAAGDSSAQVVRRDACLRDRLLELRALTEFWNAPDPSVVEHLVDGARWLGPVAQCEDPPLLAVPELLDPRIRAQAQQVREVLGRARASAATAAFARGLPLAKQAVELTQGLGDAHPLGGEAQLVLAELLIGSGQTEAGGRAIDLALNSSIAGGDPQLLIRAATAAARFAANGGHQPAQVLQLAAIGRAALERGAGRPSHQAAQLVADLDLVEAMGHRLAGQHAAASAVLTHALEIRVAALGDRDLGVAEVLVALGQSATAARSFDAGLDFQRRALAVREDLLGPSHPLVAVSCASVAAALVSVARIAEAREFASRALAIRERAFGEDQPQIADSLGQLGSIEAELGHIDLALASHRRALAIREKSPDIVALTTTLNLLAATLVTLGRWDEADGVLRRALDVGAAMPGPLRTEVATSHFHLGRTAHARGDFTRAAAELTLALDTRRALLGESDLTVAVTSTWLARVQRDAGQLDAALQAAQAALATLDVHADPDTWASARLVVADVLWARGDSSTALAGVADAIAILRGDPPAPAAAAMLEAWRNARDDGDGIAIDP